MNDSIPGLAGSKDLPHFLPLFLLAICLSYIVLTPLYAQQIYKWTDENGSVHYSDRPDPDAQTEQIVIKPSKEATQDKNPDETLKRLQATTTDLEAGRQQREAAREKEQERLRKLSEQNGQQEKETDKRESNRDRWYYGGFPQRPSIRPPTKPPNKPPIKPRPPTAVPLPSGVPTGK
jgi:hypothetical protein